MISTMQVKNSSRILRKRDLKLGKKKKNFKNNNSTNNNNNNNNNNIELPEYIVDPRTKVTYLKGKFLGKGGFARVHELTDLTTNRLYAGKIIPKCRLITAHQKEKILREIELHRSLTHKRIVRFHHFFEDDDHVYIVLEYCTRKSLVHVLKNRKLLTEPEVRYFMLQFLEGVDYIHRKGIIHRDLKLGNLFLTENMELKIGDFGLATHYETEKNTKVTVCGTPNYIAPEVLNMEGHYMETDIWAVGCIMYAMLVGQPPFETSTLTETYARIMGNNYSLPDNISEQAADLIMKMLKNKPTDRPSIEQILKHSFFTSGYTPVELSPLCCMVSPKFPLATLSRCSVNISDQMDDITDSITNIQLDTQPKSKVSKSKHQSLSAFKNKLSNIFCPEKGKKFKQYSTLALYQMVHSSLESMPIGELTNPAPINDHLVVFVTKWIDYSNKYGFGFQLSDYSIGVLFNDTSKISLSSDRTHIEYHDLNRKLNIFTITNIPSNLHEKYTLLKYFAQYMDENLTEGGEPHMIEYQKGKSHIPYMKRWVRTPHAILMQLSTGTVQINFFKDHTKIVISIDQRKGIVTYISEDRLSTSYLLSDIAQQGCEACIRTRLQYALSVLQQFAETKDF